MNLKTLPSIPLLAATTMAVPAAAATVSVTVPRINVAEYHKPYVVGWLEPVAGGEAKTVFVWYDLKKGGRELVSVPITVPRGGGAASGKTELGAVSIR